MACTCAGIVPGGHLTDCPEWKEPPADPRVEKLGLMKLKVRALKAMGLSLADVGRAYTKVPEDDEDFKELTAQGVEVARLLMRLVKVLDETNKKVKDLEKEMQHGS